MRGLLLIPFVGMTACTSLIKGEPVPLGVRVIQDTALAGNGKLGVEMGFTVDPGDRKTVPIYFEYGVSETLDVFAELSAYEKVNLPGDDGEGLGDTLVGVRTLLFETDSGTSGLLEGYVSIPTGDEDEGTGSGSLDWFAAGVVSQAFAQATFSGWLELGLLGNALSSDQDTSQRVGGSVSVNLGDEVLGFMELENEQVEELHRGFARVGVAWRSGASTVMDVGVALGLDGEAADAVYFVGFSTSLGLLGHKPLPVEVLPR